VKGEKKEDRKKKLLYKGKGRKHPDRRRQKNTTWSRGAAKDERERRRPTKEGGEDTSQRIAKKRGKKICRMKGYDFYDGKAGKLQREGQSSRRGGKDVLLSRRPTLSRGRTSIVKRRTGTKKRRRKKS